MDTSISLWPIVDYTLNWEDGALVIAFGQLFVTMLSIFFFGIPFIGIYMEQPSCQEGMESHGFCIDEIQDWGWVYLGRTYASILTYPLTYNMLQGIELKKAKPVERWWKVFVPLTILHSMGNVYYLATRPPIHIGYPKDRWEEMVIFDNFKLMYDWVSIFVMYNYGASLPQEMKIDARESIEHDESDRKSLEPENAKMIYITFYAERRRQGAQEMIVFTREENDLCQNLVEMDKKSSSIDTHGRCFLLCKERDCKGNCVETKDFFQMDEMSLWWKDLNKEISSVKMCQKG